MRHVSWSFILLFLALGPTARALPDIASYLTLCDPNSAPYKHDGLWELADDDAHRELKKQFDHQPGTGVLAGKEIKRVTDRALTSDLNRAEDLKKALEDPHSARNMASVYYLTSGAGLWTRGGNQVKALVPLNLFKILGKEKLARVETLARILGMTDPHEVLREVGITLKAGEDPKVLSAKIMSEAKQELSDLIATARNNPESLTPLDLKFVNVALESQRAGTHIPFDVWTSVATHEPIRDYIAWLKKNYTSKQFHPDAATNRKIHQALQQYFAEAAKLGETNVFGYQEGYHGIDKETGEPLPATGIIGPGAGLATAYLQKTGRAGQLKAQGKTTLIFDNIEVVTDLPAVVNSHFQSGAPVSVVLVPVGAGYKGGSPFLIDGKLQIVEQSAIPENMQYLLNGNDYFNSNTFVMPLDAKYPDAISFEEKKSGGHVYIRGKINVGDITHLLPTAGIGGRQGKDYEDLKTYGAYATSGEKPILFLQALWGQRTGDRK